MSVSPSKNKRRRHGGIDCLLFGMICTDAYLACRHELQPLAPLQPSQAPPFQCFLDRLAFALTRTRRDSTSYAYGLARARWNSSSTCSGLYFSFLHSLNIAVIFYFSHFSPLFSSMPSLVSSSCLFMQRTRVLTVVLVVLAMFASSKQHFIACPAL